MFETRGSFSSDENIAGKIGENPGKVLMIFSLRKP